MGISKTECISIFNAMIRGTPLPFLEKLIPLVFDYLTEIKYEKSDKIINLIIQNPQLMEFTIPTIVDYYCKKYNIFILKLDPKGLNKTILYYG